MTLVTLIGEKLAIEGGHFTYLGPNNDCRNCKLKTVCFNLKPGREYEITAIRDKQHSCNVHEGNVVVVEVKEMEILASIDGKLAEGVESKINKIECKNIGCPYYETCNNMALQKDKTYKIKKLYEKIECPIGYDLNKAELEEID